MVSEGKFSFKWVALLASAAGTPWMVHQTTQVRDQAIEATHRATDSADALWNDAKGSMSALWNNSTSNQGLSSRDAKSGGNDGWSFPSDPKSLNSNGFAGNGNGYPENPNRFASAPAFGMLASTGEGANAARPLNGNGQVVANSQLQQSSPAGVTNSAPVDFREFFRFDATPDWIAQTYPRVSTVETERDLFGYRAPLVSGNKLNDLTGTITYYFDRYQKVQRIQFQGVTGDPQPLIYLMTSFYYFVPKPVLGGQLFVVAWNSDPTGVFEVTRANVVFSANQPGSFRIFLEINQPSVPGGVSPEGRKILERHFGSLTAR